MWYKGHFFRRTVFKFTELFPSIIRALCFITAKRNFLWNLITRIFYRFFIDGDTLFFFFFFSLLAPVRIQYLPAASLKPLSKYSSASLFYNFCSFGYWFIRFFKQSADLIFNSFWISNSIRFFFSKFVCAILTE
jgi:hypothetical protein